MIQAAVAAAKASPSLALIKYWGKSDSLSNLPATPSVALTLEKLSSETRVWAIRPSLIGKHIEDEVWLDGEYQAPGRFELFFDGLRNVVGRDFAFWAESTNNFPTAAGLASSSSGFAALTLAACRAAGYSADSETLSSLARLGSGSAARSLYGGITHLPAASESARQLYDHNYWPALRVVIVRIEESAKEISSREAMERTRLSSPYYDAWVADAQVLSKSALDALSRKDFNALGAVTRQSYLRMFATMFGADPPIVYWKPDSLRIIRLCDDLRKRGIGAWETMDAGPQVKIICLVSDVGKIVAEVENALGIGRCLVDAVGSGPRLLEKVLLLPEQPGTEINSKAEKLGISLSALKSSATRPETPARTETAEPTPRPAGEA